MSVKNFRTFGFSLLSVWTAAVVIAFNAAILWAQSDSPTPTPNTQSSMSEAQAQGENSLPGVTVASQETLQEGLTLSKLSNGLTVIIQENHTAPTATVRCFVRYTGSINETGHLGAGLSHVLEHVVAGGSTTKRSEDEIKKLVDLMGGVTNAFTSTDVTAYFIDCPASDTALAIELVADQMQRAAFVPEEFNRELNVVQQELRDGEVSRARVMWKLISETRYTKSPARLPVIGYLDVLARTSNEDIINFYKERYVPNNQVFVVAGDIDTATVLEQVRAQYEGTPRGKMSEIYLPEEPAQVSPRMAVKEMDGPTFDVTIFWPTIKLDSEDLYALDVLDYVLGEGASSRLVKKYCMDQPLALSMSAMSATPSYATGMFGVRMSLTEENYPAVVEQVTADVYALRDTLIPEAELQKAKKQKAAERVFQQQTVQSQADSFAQSYISTGDPLFDKTYVEQIQKVTAEDIQRVARKYFVPERFNKVVITPLGKSKAALESAQQEENSKLVEVKLPNGVTVLTKRIPNLPLVYMQAYIKGAALTETPETAGVSKLAAEMCERGTASMTATEIAEYFDSVGGAFACSSARNTTSASIATLKEDFPKASEIMAECFLRPAFPQEEFDKVKVQVLGMIQRKKADPRSEASEAFCNALPATSIFHTILGGTTESVSKITLDDVKNYHKSYVQPEGMVVAIFGDISNADAIAQATKLFGSLKGAPVPVSFDRSNKLTGNVVKHVKTEKPTAMVFIGYECPSIYQEDDYYSMLVLNAIMTGYGYPGGWLFPELRGEGLVYSAHGVRMTGPCPGYFTFIAQTRPDAVEEVVRRIRNNVEKAKAGTITQEEFEKAKKMITALHAQDNTTAGAQATQSALDEILGQGALYDKQYDQRVNAVTLERVKAVAKKYLGGYSVQTTLSNQEK